MKRLIICFVFLIKTVTFAQRNFDDDFSRRPDDFGRDRDRDRVDVVTGDSILARIEREPDLREFAEVLRQDGLHKSFFQRQVTLFAPSNEAMRRYRGRRDENLALNHMVNIALATEFLPEKMTSMVTGNPPLWVTRSRTGVHINQAKVVRGNIRARSERGDEQVSRNNFLSIQISLFSSADAKKHLSCMCIMIHLHHNYPYHQ